jgi:hypothetical protein
MVGVTGSIPVAPTIFPGLSASPAKAASAGLHATCTQDDRARAHGRPGMLQATMHPLGHLGIPVAVGARHLLSAQPSAI